MTAVGFLLTAVQIDALPPASIVEVKYSETHRFVAIKSSTGSVWLSSSYSDLLNGRSFPIGQTFLIREGE